MPGCLVHEIPAGYTRPGMRIGRSLVFENRHSLPETYHSRYKLEQMHPLAHNHMLHNSCKRQHSIYARKRTNHSPEAGRTELKPLSGRGTPAPEPTGKPTGRVHIGQHHSCAGCAERQRRTENSPCPPAKGGHNTFDNKILFHIYVFYDHKVTARPHRPLA